MDESRLLLWRPFRRDPVIWISLGIAFGLAIFEVSTRGLAHLVFAPLDFLQIIWTLAPSRRRLRLLRMRRHARKYGAPASTYPNLGNPAAPHSLITRQETDEIIPVSNLARGLR